MRVISIAIIALAAAGCRNSPQAQPQAVAIEQSEEALEKAPMRPAAAGLAPELIGRTAQVHLLDGRTILVRYNIDGSAHMTGPQGLNMKGEWFVAFKKLCFEWPGMPRECWPYPSSPATGERVKSQSDRGQVIRTTLLPITPDAHTRDN